MVCQDLKWKAMCYVNILSYKTNIWLVYTMFLLKLCKKQNLCLFFSCRVHLFGTAVLTLWLIFSRWCDAPNCHKLGLRHQLTCHSCFQMNSTRIWITVANRQQPHTLFSSCPLLFFPSSLSQQLHVYLLVSVVWRHDGFYSRHGQMDCVLVWKNAHGFGVLPWIKDRGSLMVKGKVTVAQAAFSHQPSHSQAVKCHVRQQWGQQW